MFERAERHSTRWIAWMPLLFVSAFLYWSVALGLGGLSLMAAGTLSGGCPMSRQAFSATAVEPAPGTLSGEAIMVHLQESADLDQDEAGDAVQPVVIDVSDNDGTGRLPGHD